MTAKLTILKKLITNWEHFYQLDDELPEKSEAASRLLTFYDSLPHITLVKKDVDAIMSARFYLQFHK